MVGTLHILQAACAAVTAVMWGCMAGIFEVGKVRPLQ